MSHAVFPRIRHARSLHRLGIAAALLFGLIGILAVAAPAANAAPTHVSGTISQDTTWDLAGSPYVIDSTVTVNTGVTLTVEPGVVVKSGNSGLAVAGFLHAEGTIVAPIIFTSLKDDTVAGDTNGNGSATSPAAGDWAGLRFDTGGVGALSHATVHYAGGNYYWSYAGVSLAAGNTLSLTESQIVDTRGYGLYANNPSALTLQDSTIAYSGSVGVYIYGPQHAVTVTGNTIRDGGHYGIYVQASDSSSSLSNVSLAGNTITGNHFNCVYLTGNVHADWELPAYPEGDQACYWTSNLQVAADATLTLDPGVVMKGSLSVLSVSGALVAEGTIEWPITFTSINDDTVAGDTNGNGSATGPAAGDWDGVHFVASGASGALEHVLVHWAGRASTAHATAGISLAAGSSLSLTDSQLLTNNGYGLYASNPTALTVQYCTIVHSGAAGVQVRDPQHPVTITGNMIRDGGSYGIWLYARATAASLSHVTLHVDGFADNRLVGNHKNCVYLEGYIRSDWYLPAYPEADEACYLTYGSGQVAAGATVTVEPGSVFKDYDSGWSVSGALVAEGTTERPITFTSINDDTVAGDTNADGSAASPAAGDWAGLTFEAGGVARLEYIILHCAGRPTTAHVSSAYSAAIYLAPGARGDVHHSDISANQGYGFWAPPGAITNTHAEDNWWGSVSGPYPYGAGNAIAHHVEYDPWGRPYTVIDVAADPWLGQTMWEGPSLGAAGWCGYDSDPVNVSTGNFTYEATDVSIPTRGLPLEVTRSYNSLLTQDSPFGQGWAFSYNLHVKEEGSLGGTAEYVAVTREDGGQLWFREEADGSFTPPPGVHDVLTRQAGGLYRLTTKEHTVYAFDAGGRLAFVTDRNGNETNVNYDDNGIAMVTAPDGRILDFTCDADGHVVALSDPLGRDWSYDYDASGNLISVTDPAGGVTHYTYDGEHRLLTIVDANGHTPVTNTYDPTTGRVATQKDARGNLTHFTYNLASGKTYVRNPLGKTTTYVSNTNHCLISVTPPRGGTTYSSYDSDNNKIELTDPLGRTTHYTYDGRGNLLTTTNPAGDVSTLTYDAHNNPLTKTDFAGHASTYEYDGNGNLTEATDPLDHVTSSTYDAYGQLESSTNARGKTTLSHHNARGDLTWTETPNGHRTTAEYDAVGRKTSETTARGKTTTYAYDDVNRVTTTIDPLSHQGKTYYDAVGNKIRVRDARGHDATFTYDACNNQTSVTVAEGTAAEATTTYAYDAKNRLASFTDANDHTTTYAYDDDGNRIRRTDPRGRVRNQTFDVAGNLISATDAKNQTTSYAYDLLNRLTTITKPGSVTVGFTYDEVGNRLTTVDSRGTTTYTYNAVGWLTSVTTPDGDEVAYSYYADGKRHTLTYPDDREAEYVYNDDGELTVITGPAGDTTAYTYYADGSLHTTNLPNGITGTDVYDDAGRLSSISYSDGATLLSIAYTRNNNGAPTAIDDSRLGQSTYTYDALDQLTSETRGGSTTSYTYDGVGNRLTKTVDGVTTDYSYSAANELTGAGGASYTYDANGSRATRTQGGATTTYSWNSDNLLTSTSSTATATSYAYDGENQRIAAIEDGVRTDFVLDSAVGDEVVLQETTGEDVVTYTYGSGLISRETSDGIRYLLADGLGSVRLETDEDGDIVREHSYEAFGSELGSPDLTGNRFRFTGQWSDPAGLVFLRARFYDPETGAFLSIDPVPTVSNLYMYCSNNPLFRVDPSGMIAWTPAWQGFANFWAGFADSFAGIVGRHVGQPYHGPGLNWSYHIGQGDGFIVQMVVADAAVAQLGRWASACRTAAQATKGASAAARAGAKAASGEVTEGIYVIRGADGAYVGQSGSISTRLGQHVASGRFTEAEVNAAERFYVPGGKTSREIAEQLKIDELGGVDSLLNVRNPIGSGRLELMPEGYVR